MNGALDGLLVLLALLVSVGYTVLALGPRTGRRAFAAWLLKGLARAPRSFRHFALERRLQRLGAASACGGCDGCGETKTPAAAREVKVPLATIGRRR